MFFGRTDVSTAYRSLGFDPADEHPPPVKAATYLAPSGLGFLALATLLAASSWICVEECVRDAELYEERLLECEESCRVDSTKGSDKARGMSCKDECAGKIGFTLGKLRRRRASCEKGCGKSPWLMRLCSTVGVLALLAVAPLLGSYRNSCRCECCMGEGCSARLALFNVAWFFYGMGCLWVLPSVVEEPAEIGGKVLFGMTQAVAMTAMYYSRSLAEKTEREVARSIKHEQQMGSIVGAAVQGPSNAELQQQMTEIQQQVREVLRLQSKQMQEQQISTAPEAPPAGI